MTEAPLYTSQALVDIHDRAHRSLRKLLEHCRGLSAESLNRELPGFAYPTVRLQLHHLIGAEEYWIGVIRGSFRVDEDDASYPTIPALEVYRAATARAAESYLREASPAELNGAREMLTWQGDKRVLVPALIILRTQMHIYQHQGQIVAMCRLLENPCPPGLDFPLD